MSSRYKMIPQDPVGCGRWEIIDTQNDDVVVDMARNEARARLLVIRYNREAANGNAV